MPLPPGKVVLVCGRKGAPFCTHTPEFSEAACSACGVAVMASPVTTNFHVQYGDPFVCVECYAAYQVAGNPVVNVRLERPYCERT